MVYAAEAAVVVTLLLIYKKSWFLKLYVHNALDVLFELKRKLSVPTEEYDLPADVSRANAKAPLKLKSYMNNTQNVHPKVLYFSCPHHGRTSSIRHSTGAYSRQKTRLLKP